MGQFLKNRIRSMLFAQAFHRARYRLRISQISVDVCWQIAWPFMGVNLAVVEDKKAQLLDEN